MASNMKYQVRQMGEPENRSKPIDAKTKQEAASHFAADLRSMHESHNGRPLPGPLYVVVSGRAMTARADGSVVLGLSE